MAQQKIERALADKLQKHGTESVSKFGIFLQASTTLQQLVPGLMGVRPHDSFPLEYCELAAAQIRTLASQTGVEFIWDAEAEILLSPHQSSIESEPTNLRDLIFVPAAPDHPPDGQAYRGGSIRCAVIDTAADINHPDLAGRIKKACDCTDDDDFALGSQDHGTHVAGIIAQIAPDADLWLYKVFNRDTRATRKSIVDAIVTAVNDGVHIINGSWGDKTCGGGCPIELAAIFARKRGVIFCGSAGNEGPERKTLTCPAGSPATFTIGSTTVDRSISDFSSRGPGNHDAGLKPDIVAPGQMISSCRPGGGYQTMSGTSMASPAAAGGVAILLSYVRQNDLAFDLSPPKIIEKMKAGADDLDCDKYAQGAGFININSAISHLESDHWSSFVKTIERIPLSTRALWAISLVALVVTLLAWPWPGYEQKVVSAEPVKQPPAIFETVISMKSERSLKSADTNLTDVQVKAGEIGAPQRGKMPKAKHDLSMEIVKTLEKVRHILQEPSR